VTTEGRNNLKDGSVPDCQLQLASFGVDRGDPEGYVKCDVGNELHSKNIISESSTGRWRASIMIFRVCLVGWANPEILSSSQIFTHLVVW
jgi:hypothetical protein